MASDPVYSTILIELTKAVKMHNFYPKGHPQLDAALDKCLSNLKTRLDEKREIKWTIDQNGFYDSDKTPITGGNHDIAAIAKRLFFRRVREVTFTSRITDWDLKVLLNFLKLEPSDIQARGGSEMVLAAGGVTGILINALRLEDLQKLKDRVEVKEEKGLSKEDIKDPGSGKPVEEQVVIPPKPRDESSETSLEELLQRLEAETDLLKYNDLSVRIRERAGFLQAERRFEELFPVVLAFQRHSSPGSGREFEITDIASVQMKALLSPGMIGYLVLRIGNRDEEHRGEIESMLLASLHSIDPLIDAYVEARTGAVKRHYLSALALFGEAVIPRVEARITGEEAAVRQMISLLGELGGEAAVGAIEKALAHYIDPRIRREALKSLSRIKSPRSTELLLKALGESDKSVVLQAIISLGMLRDSSSIDVIGPLALKWERFSEKYDIQEEAIKALGNIGDGKAVPYLSQVLSRKVWIGRKANNGFRELAANSLGMIGTEEAFRAVENAMRRSSGELQASLRRILERRRNNNERDRAGQEP